MKTFLGGSEIMRKIANTERNSAHLYIASNAKNLIDFSISLRRYHIAHLSQEQIIVQHGNQLNNRRYRCH